MVWKAGKTASALRTCALSCLLSLTSNSNILNKAGKAVAEKTVDTILGLVDDQSELTRLLAIQCLGVIPAMCSNQVDTDMIHKIYPGN